MFRNVLKILIGLILIFISQKSIGQANDSVIEKKSKNYCEGIEGTWQIQMISTRKKPAIPANICERITEERLKNEVHYIQLSPITRIMVLPKKTINSSKFSPISKIKYMTADEIGN